MSGGDVFQFINDLERPVGTCLYGRRMHEVMAAWETDPSVAGQSALAGQAMRAGLVDELHLFVAPVHVGGGTRAFPRDVRLDLDLQDQRRFGNGMVYLRYRTIG